MMTPKEMAEASVGMFANKAAVSLLSAFERDGIDSTTDLRHAKSISCPFCGNAVEESDRFSEYIGDINEGIVEVVSFDCDVCGTYSLVAQTYMPTLLQVKLSNDRWEDDAYAYGKKGAIEWK